MFRAKVCDLHQDILALQSFERRLLTKQKTTADLAAKTDCCDDLLVQRYHYLWQFAGQVASAILLVLPFR